MKALIVGASAGVGRALSETLATHGYSMILVASDAQDLESQASYLRLVYGVRVKVVAADANRAEDFLGRILLAAEDFGHIDGLFFPIGVSLNNDRGMLSIGEARFLFETNFLIIAGIIGHFLPDFLASGRGNIVGFGSVAAIRGRGSNMVYSAAKRGLESYFESLQHLVAGTDIRVQLYRLGYINTQQSFGKHLLFPSISPNKVAQEVVGNLDIDQRFFYFPRYWAFVANMVAFLPWGIFKKLNF